MTGWFVYCGRSLNLTVKNQIWNETFDCKAIQGNKIETVVFDFMVFFFKELLIKYETVTSSK